MPKFFWGYWKKSETLPHPEEKKHGLPLYICFRRALGGNMDFWQKRSLFLLKKYAVWQKNTGVFPFFRLPIFVQHFSGQKDKILRYRKTELTIFYIPV